MCAPDISAKSLARDLISNSANAEGRALFDLRDWLSTISDWQELMIEETQWQE
ncbi:MAG: hypothetical protein AAFV93_14030 [Chloroflexota bacterium]